MTKTFTVAHSTGASLNAAGGPYQFPENYGYYYHVYDENTALPIPGVITTDTWPANAQVTWQPGPPVAPYAPYDIRTYIPDEVPKLVEAFFSKVALGMSLEGEDVKTLLYRYIHSVGGCVTFDLINKKTSINGLIVLVASITVRSVGTTGSEWEVVEQFLFNENGTRCFIEIDKPAAKE